MFPNLALQRLKVKILNRMTDISSVLIIIFMSFIRRLEREIQEGVKGYEFSEENGGKDC